MRVRRALVTHFIEVEETGIWDTFLAEGIEPIAAVVGEEPGGAECNCSGRGRDLRR